MGQEQSSLEAIRRNEYRQPSSKSNQHQKYKDKNKVVSVPATKNIRHGSVAQDARKSHGPSPLTLRPTPGKEKHSQIPQVQGTKKKRMTISHPHATARKSENFSKAAIKSYFNSWSEQPRRSSNQVANQASQSVHQDFADDFHNQDTIHELPGTLPSDLYFNKLNANTRFKTKSHASIRASSLRQPGVATRAAVDVRDEDAEHALPNRILSQKYSSSSGAEDLGEGFQDRNQTQNPSLQPQRTETPNDLEHGHIGAFKLGSLRITNGAASPTLSREQVLEDKKDPSIQKRRFPDHNQHNRSLSRDITKSWDVSRESPLRQTQGYKSLSSGLSVQHPNFEFETHDFHEDMISSIEKISQVLDVHENSFFPEELTPFSLFDVPYSSPVTKNSKKRIAVSDRLFDEEPWTPSIHDITKSVKSQKPSFLKADSGYQSNISSQSSEKEIIPKTLQAEANPVAEPLLGSRSFSFTTPSGSTDDEMNITAQKNLPSSLICLTDKHDDRSCSKRLLQSEESNARDLIHKDFEISGSPGFTKELRSQANTNDMIATYTNKECSKTFLLDATPPISPGIIKANDTQTYDEINSVSGNDDNLNPKDFGYPPSGLKIDEEDINQSASNPSKMSLSINLKHQPIKKKGRGNALDPKAIDIPRTPSLTSSMTTFTTESLVTPETQCKICPKHSENSEFVYPNTREISVEPSPTQSPSSRVNSAYDLHDNNVSTQKQPSISHLNSSSFPPTPLTLQASPILSGDSLSTEALLLPENPKIVVQEPNGVRFPHENTSSTTTTTPPLMSLQSKLQVSLLPPPLKIEKSQAFESKSLEVQKPVDTSHRTIKESAIDLKDNDSLSTRSTSFMSLSILNNSGDKIKDQRSSETILPKSTLKKTVQTNSTVSSLITNLQEKGRTQIEKTEIKLERPTVKKINLDPEELTKKMSRNSTLTIDTEKASHGTKNFSIQPPNFQPDFAEICTRLSNLKSAREMESESNSAGKEVSDQTRIIGSRQRATSISRGVLEGASVADGTTHVNLPSTRRLSTPTRYRRPPLTPPPTSSLKMTDYFTKSPTRTVEQNSGRFPQNPSTQFSNSGPTESLSAPNLLQNLSHDASQSPQRQESRRRSSNVPSIPASSVLGADFLDRNMDKQHLSNMSSNPGTRAALNIEKLHNNTGPSAPKKTSPVVVQGPNSLRRSKSSYPPQAHANRYSQMIYARTPPPVPKILDFYSQIENTQRKMEQMQLPQITTQRSSHDKTKLKEKRDAYLPKILQKIDRIGNSTQSTKAIECVSGDSEKPDLTDILARQRRYNSVTSVRGELTSKQPTDLYTPNLPNYGVQATHAAYPKVAEDNLLRTRKSSDLRGPQQNRRESILKNEKFENHATALAAQSRKPEESSPKSDVLKGDKMALERQDENVSSNESTLMSSISKSGGVNNLEQSSGIVRKSKPPDLVLQPSLRPKFLSSNSIDSLPSQNAFGSRAQGSNITLYTSLNLNCNSSLKQSTSTRSSSSLFSSAPSSFDLGSRENANYASQPEDRQKTTLYKDEQLSDDSKLNSSAFTYFISPKSELVSPPSPNFQVSTSHTSISLTSPSPILSPIHDSLDANRAEKLAHKKEFDDIVQRPSMPARKFSSIDTLPSQRNNLRFSSLERPARLLSSENHRLNLDLKESIRRFKISKESETKKASISATNTSDHSFPSNAHIPEIYRSYVSSPPSPMNFPTIPKSIGTYHQPSLSRTSDLYPLSPSQSSMSAQNSTGGISRSHSVSPSSATSFMSCCDYREIVNLAAGWR